MTTRVRIVKDTYLDSVVQLSGTRAMRAVDGVDWATAAMATPANLETLEHEGFDGDDLAGAGPGDLVLAVRAASEDAVEAAEEAGRDAMFSARAAETGADAAEAPARTQAEALARLAGGNVAVISVPGDHAALETHKALSEGLHVLLFSDNVPVAAEVELKTRAEQLGLLVMGPGAGTAMLGRTCLGFANVVAPLAERTGAVAVVAAAGTGAQEAAVLLDRAGVGVTHVVGLGGRDLSADVGGIMGRTAVRALAADPATEAILLVSKPPDARVAATVTAQAGDTPLVAALIGLDEPTASRSARHLETGVLAVAGPPRPPTPRRHRSACAPRSRRRSPRSGRSARWCAACSPAGPSATSRWSSWDGSSARCTRTPRSTSSWACRPRRPRTSASTWARRSTPAGGRTR